MESKYSPLILALVFLIFYFCFYNVNANNPSQKTNKGFYESNLHLASHKGWSNDPQTIVWNHKNYYDIYFLHSVMGLLDPLDPICQDWTHTTTKDFITYSKQDCYTSKGW